MDRIARAHQYPTDMQHPTRSVATAIKNPRTTLRRAYIRHQPKRLYIASERQLGTRMRGIACCGCSGAWMEPRAGPDAVW